MLQALAADRQAQYLLHKLISESSFASLLKPEAAKDLYRSVTNRFEMTHGLLFNNSVTLKTVEDREKFSDLVDRMRKAGVIGPRPVNLSPDLKITREEAEELRRDGKTVEEWFIRTDEEEEEVKKMIEDWNNKKDKD